MERTIARTEWRWACVAALLILLAAIAPFLWAEWTTPPEYHYGGVLFNEVDSSLLLGAMWQGAQGHWLYRPQYATGSDDGAFIYPQYLFLGHVAAWLHVDPVVIFHAARLLGGFILLLSIYWFAARCLPTARARRIAMLLAGIGSGLGWTSLLLGGPTLPDVGQPEGFPFFALFSNLHFTWSMAALLWLLDALVPLAQQDGKRVAARLVCGSLIVGITQPFAVVVVGVTGTLWSAATLIAGSSRTWKHWLLPCESSLRRPHPSTGSGCLMPFFCGLLIASKRVPWRTAGVLAVMAACSAPFILYQLWTISTHPAFIGWRQQVSTLTPEVWKLALAIGLALPFALIGIARAVRRRNANDLLLLAWLGALALLLYLPYYQNARFIFGAFILCALLATLGFEALPGWLTGARPVLVVALSTLTNLLIVLSVFYLVSQQHPVLFITRAEWQALEYLHAHAPERAVVLASPRLSLSIMASGDMRIVYGHPWETPHGPETLAAVQQFYGGSLADARMGPFLQTVNYIVVGPSERAYGAPMIPAAYAKVYEAGGVAVYQQAGYAGK